MGERLRKLYVTIHMKLLCKILISIPVHLHWATRALQKSKPDHTILLVKRHPWPPKYPQNEVQTLYLT